MGPRVVSERAAGDKLAIGETVSLAGEVRELILEPGKVQHTSFWFIGYEEEGVFRPFAGGCSNQVLQQLIRVEMDRYPGVVVVRDRR